MAANKENAHKPNYCIKLLAGNNVVLVEANNYESEIFVPQIINGRITFQNIIPNRRCCQNGGKAAMKSSQNVQSDNDKRPFLAPIPEIGNVKPMCRLSAGQTTELPQPLANSTPAGVKGMKSQSELNVAPNSASNSLLTPEPVRKAVPAAKSIFSNNSKNNIMQMPRGLKLLPHDSLNGTPKKLGRVVANSSRGSKDLTNVSRLNGSFRLPTTPSMSNSARGKSSSIQSSATQSSNCLQTTLGSVSKWTKVRTPLRTYTRLSDKPLMLRRNNPASSSKKCFRSKKVIPTYLVNPTQAPKVTHKIEMMRRKLIVDGKVSISPRTFKKQQLEPMTPAKNLPHRKSLAAKTNLPKSVSYASSLPKSRRQMESIKLCAFDLLTNSNHFRSMSDSLNEQFRKGCVNKASSTYNKYKVLCNVPPLQQDEQILDISSSNTLQQKSKRNVVHATKSISTQIRLPSCADIRTGFKIY